jgi:hypothetical protein
MDPLVNNKHAINRTPTAGIDPPWTAASTLRTIGVLADVAWSRGEVTYIDRPGRGFVTCDACLNGTEHELYRPVRDLNELVAAFFGLREPADVVAFVTRYGFLTNRHGDPQRPAQVDVMGLLFRVADLREFRRLALEPLSHRLLDDAQLLDRADTFRAERQRAFAEAARAGASGQEAQRRAETQVSSLSVDAHWRRSAEAAGWRRSARDQLTASLKEMKIRWRSEPGEAVVELVPTSLLQLVSYVLLLELRGDEAIGHCLECNRPLPAEGSRRGRPRLYCPPDPASGLDCATAVSNRKRREARRVTRYATSHPARPEDPVPGRRQSGKP